MADSTLQYFDQSYRDPQFFTTPELIRFCLQVAQLQPNETMMDLGCGDGRSLRIAAEEFGAKAVGVELDDQRFAEAQTMLQQDELRERVELRHASYLETPLEGVDVIYLYLTRYSLGMLSFRFEELLPPGIRIVVHTFTLPGYEHHEVHQFATPMGEMIPVYLYCS